MSLSEVFSHTFYTLLATAQNVGNVLYHNLLRSETMVTLMTLIGLAVGVEYGEECSYSFCLHQTQSIILQASQATQS